MGIFSWSKTANSNTTLELVTAAEGMSPAAVNNLVRAVAAGLKKWQEDMGAALTTAGAANTYTLTTNSTLAALEDGQNLGFVCNVTNTGASTLAVDGLAAKAIRREGDLALLAGQLVAGGHYDVSHDASANGAAGAWMLRNPTFVVSNLDIAGATVLTAPAAGDEFLVNDISVPGVRKITLSNALKVIADLTPKTIILAEDILGIYSDADSDVREVTAANLLTLITDLPELAEAPAYATDYSVIIDASDSGLPKKILTKRLGAGTQRKFYPYQVMKPTLVSPAIAYESTTTDISGWRFPQDVVRSVHLREMMETAWNLGTVTFRIAWAPHDTVGTGNVVWGIQAKAVSHSDNLEAAFGTAVTVTSAVQADTDLVIPSETGAITISGTPAIGDMIIFRIYRDGTNVADTYDAAVILLGVKMAYTTNAITDD